MMYLEDILKIDNFNNLSKDELIYICRALQNETKTLKNINSSKTNQEFFELNKIRNQLNELKTKYDNLDVSSKRLYKKLNVPLTFKERLSGKLDIKKINKPDKE